jgi:hypothetical protein
MPKVHDRGVKAAMPPRVHPEEIKKSDLEILLLLESIKHPFGFSEFQFTRILLIKTFKLIGALLSDGITKNKRSLLIILWPLDVALLIDCINCSGRGMGKGQIKAGKGIQ